MTTITHNGVELAIPDHPRFLIGTDLDARPCWVMTENGQPIAVADVLRDGRRWRRNDETRRRFEDMAHCAIVAWLELADMLEAVNDDRRDAGCQPTLDELQAEITARWECNRWRNLLKGEEGG